MTAPPSQPSGPVRRPWRVALVHDWLTGMRGGEKVLDLVCALFPSARLFTLVHVPGSVSRRIEALGPTQAFSGRLPLAGRYYRHLLPVFPTAVEQFDLDDVDLVVSTSHCAVKSAVATGRARHLCYCFTPMRYAWDQFDQYFGRSRLGALTALMRPTLAALARWDAGTSLRPHRYVAISQYVAARIRRYYNRPAAIVYPPVDTEFFRPTGAPSGEYVLVVSALVPYKRLDLAIDACRRAGVPLKIVGAGPELAPLRRLAEGGAVEFLGWRSDEELRTLYSEARAVLLPGEEDFGIVPVEAQACGRPVVALARGGATETIVDGETGVLVRESTAEAFLDGLRRADGLRLDPSALRASAERFSHRRFIEGLLAQIDALMDASEEQTRW